MTAEHKENGRYFTNKSGLNEKWLGMNVCEECGMGWLLEDFPGWENERKTKLKDWRCSACIEK